MTRHFQIKKFFREAPNNKLSCYFHEKNLLSDVDFEQLNETDIEPVFKEYISLPMDKRIEIEGDFKDLFTMSYEGGYKTILEVGKIYGEDLEPIISELDGFYDVAFWSFFERREIFDKALQFCNLNDLPKRYWKKRPDLPEVEAETNQKYIKDLENAVIDFFRSNEGRGHNCKIDHHKLGDKDYFFAYPEDYTRLFIEWENDKFEQVRHKLAFEIIFVYSENERTLDIYYEGSYEVVRDLQVIFCKNILKKDVERLYKDKKVYELDVLKDRNFQFVFEPTDGIEDVLVKKLRFSFFFESKKRFILEADPSYNRYAVYDLMEQLIMNDSELKSYKIPLDDLKITQVTIQVKFKPDGKRGKNTKTFDVSYPNSCSLKNEGRDLILRKMLIASKIEPH